MLAILFAMVTITSTTIAQAMLKHGINKVGGISPPGNQFLTSMQKVLTEPFIIGGLILVLLIMPLWLEVLARLPLSIAYPMVSMGYVLALIIGALVFKEAITPLRVFGVALIVIGVIAVAKSQ